MCGLLRGRRRRRSQRSPPHLLTRHLPSPPSLTHPVHPNMAGDRGRGPGAHLRPVWRHQVVPGEHPNMADAPPNMAGEHPNMADGHPNMAGEHPNMASGLVTSSRARSTATTRRSPLAVPPTLTPKRSPDPNPEPCPRPQPRT
eukprot:1865245-Prymnesium_polylepis.1